MGDPISMLVPIDDEDRTAAEKLIELCRYMPDSMAQKAAVAHALATARRRERNRMSSPADDVPCPDCRNKEANVREMRATLNQIEQQRGGGK